MAVELGAAGFGLYFTPDVISVDDEARILALLRAEKHEGHDTLFRGGGSFGARVYGSGPGQAFPDWLIQISYKITRTSTVPGLRTTAHVLPGDLPQLPLRRRPARPQ